VTGPDPRELLPAARAAAAAGAEVAAGWRRRADALDVTEKAGPGDLVSQADTEAEAAVRAVLTDLRPHDAVLGEEAGSADGTSGVRWVVDPVDGTTNYLYGRPDWAVSVAATDAAGRVLVGVVVEPAVGRTTEAWAGGGTWSEGRRLPPLEQSDLARALVELNLGRPPQKTSAGRALDALVPRVRDVRRGGSAAVALAQVATGRADACWVPGLSPWDCAAGILLVAEAGGTTGDLSGATTGCVPASGDVLAAPPALWEPLRAVLAPAYRPADSPAD
jgi:myo-inositol-1(or 4)-monophosphatase